LAGNAFRIFSSYLKKGFSINSFRSLAFITKYGLLSNEELPKLNKGLELKKRVKTPYILG
jgi:hypothetical protein